MGHQGDRDAGREPDREAQGVNGQRATQDVSWRVLGDQQARALELLAELSAAIRRREVLAVRAGREAPTGAG